MDFTKLTLKKDFAVNQIVTVHYFEYMSDFSFEGEAHPFWELLCVDKGEAYVTAGRTERLLKKDEVIFHKPDEFHNVRANGIIAPNLVVIAFDCHSPRMHFFEDKVFTIGEVERNLLGSLIYEAKNAFSSDLQDPYLKRMERFRQQPVGCEQMIRLCLEEFLIRIYRRHTSENTGQAYLAPMASKRLDEETYEHVIHYFEDNIEKQLTLSQICHENLISLSQLQRLFRSRHGSGVMEYFAKMKIAYAKQLIRDNHMNFSQISDQLGYGSIHYFSRAFKKMTGMTPTNYATSVKSRSESGI